MMKEGQDDFRQVLQSALQVWGSLSPACLTLGCNTNPDDLVINNEKWHWTAVFQSHFSDHLEEICWDWKLANMCWIVTKIRRKWVCGVM